MGLLAGDELPWSRWWAPASHELTLWQGLLPDPDDDIGRFVNRELTTLAASASARARVLLADPGMGKTTELRAEARRLEAAGSHVELLDLGRYATTAEIGRSIEDAANRWRYAATDSDLILAIDAVDEPLVDVQNLGEVLTDALARVGTDRLRVVLACRTSHWPDSLRGQFAAWWGNDDVLQLELAPLASADVAAAAKSEGLDGQTFVDAVHRAGAGPLAARPITLRLLLAGGGEGALSPSRLDVYRTGVAGLLEERGARRVERRRTGTPLDGRVAAARRLAAASLLAGLPVVVRRADAAGRPAEIALDQAVGGGVTLEELDDVWDSAVLSGTGASRRWCHHSVAEYLCGEALAALPAPSALRLLAAPGDPALLRPQLRETAGWTAAISDSVFDRLVDDDPEVVLGADLHGRGPADRERVGKAILARIARHEWVAVRSAADALDYPGVEKDLLALLDADQPLWVRREAILLTAATGTRALDDALLWILERSAEGAGYDEHVELGTYAAHALEGAQAEATRSRLRVVLADPQAPPRVRAAVATSWFPDRISASELASLVAPAERFSPTLGRQVVHAMRRAVAAGSVRPRDVIEWFDTVKDAATADQTGLRLALDAALDAAAVEDTASARWHSAVSVAVWLVDGAARSVVWDRGAVDALGGRRRVLAHAMLERNPVEPLADDLAEKGLLHVEDLPWWLERAQQTTNDASAASRAVRVLAWLALDDDATLALARERCAASPGLTALGEQEFDRDIVAARREARALSARRRAEREGERAAHLFSPDRLRGALAAADLPAVLEELDRTPGRDDPRPGRHGPVPAWRALDQASCKAVAAVAAAWLAERSAGLADFDDAHDVAVAVEVVAAADYSLFETVPRERWAQWLPALLRGPRPAAGCVALVRALASDPESVRVALLGSVDETAAGGAYPDARVLDVAGPDLRREAGMRAVKHAARSDVPVGVLSGLLAVGNAGAPAETARVALDHAGRRPPVPPPSPRRPDSEPDASWLRAVAAARALIASSAFGEVFEELLPVLRADRDFALEVVSGMDAWQVRGGWQGLNADQLAEAYLWARVEFPARRTGPGVVVGTDRSEELSGDLLDVLAARSDAGSVAALERLADLTGDAFLRSRAREHAAAVAADASPPPSPAAVLEALDDPSRRVVMSIPQLAATVTAELDAIAVDLAQDRGLRSRFWERQRDGTRWAGTWVPVEETDLSEQLKAELKRRLEGRVAVLREVQVQQHLARDGGDFTDIFAVALTTEAGVLELPVEVKGNWHKEVVTALRSQLADRYLAGPSGTEGVYVVGFFRGEDWSDADKERRRAARQRTADQLRTELAAQVALAAQDGRTVHVRVIDVPLGLRDGEPRSDRDG